MKAARGAVFIRRGGWRATCSHKAVPSLHPSAVHESHLHPAHHTSFSLTLWNGAVGRGGQNEMKKNLCEVVRNEALVHTALNSPSPRLFIRPVAVGVFSLSG